MILPKNGRVIIIDDKFTQALPLITLLSRNNIATSYFDARKENMPSKKFSDVRVLFLDLNLVGEQQLHWHTEKAILINTITSIIERNTPYILFVWSVNEKILFDDVKELFDTDLLEFQPLAILKMAKDALFTLVDVEKDVWDLTHNQEETLELIRKEINLGIASIDSFEALVKWENIVNESSSEVVNNLMQLAVSKNEVNNDLKQIYLNLAIAYWGKKLDNKAPDEIISKSLINLNSILNDKIEYKVLRELELELINGFPTKSSIDAFTKSILNTRLLFSEDVINEPLPGNLYVLQNDERKKEIVEKLIDRSTFSFNYCEENSIEKREFFEGQDIKPEYKKAFTKYSFKKIDEITQAALYIEVELTPVCDYSQGNQLFFRMVSGIILPERYRHNLKKTATFFYVSPIFQLKGQPVNFYCDFRYIRSEEVSYLKDVKPEIRIRHLFQTDIQSQMARQVSRPGIVSI